MVNLLDQPVILLAGTEQFLKEEALARIKSTFLDKASREFNFNVFYATTGSAREVLECATTAPFLGRKRVVLVRQVEDFSASDKKLILSYVKAPYKSTLLLLETSEGNLYQNSLNEIRKYARVIFCRPLEGERLFAWIKKQAQARGKSIEEKAKNLLVDNLGSDLGLLSRTLDNLVLYIGQTQTIGLSDVEKLVGPDFSTSAFELFDAVTLRNKEKAFQILESLLKEGINSSQILGALTHKIISERDRLNSSEFERLLQQLQETDSDIKRGKKEQRLALELLTTRLLGLF